MIGIIFFICNLFTLMIMQLVSLGTEKTRRNRRFGIYLPSERLDDERVLEVVAKYRRQNKVWFWISFVTLFINFIDTPYISILFSAFMIWNFGMIYWKFSLYAHAANALKKLKSEYRWSDEIHDAEEKYWFFGMFYYNPNSPKLWVNHQSGMGSTINIATKAGKRIMIATVVFIVVTLVPLWIGIVMDDFVAPNIELDNDALVIRSFLNKTEIEYDDISQIQLISELTSGTKVNGSATELYRRGLFYISAYGRCELSVYNAVSPIIVIIPIEGVRPVLLNTATAEETMALYNELLQKISQ